METLVCTRGRIFPLSRQKVDYDARDAAIGGWWDI